MYLPSSRLNLDFCDWANVTRWTFILLIKDKKGSASLRVSRKKILHFPKTWTKSHISQWVSTLCIFLALWPIAAQHTTWTDFEFIMCCYRGLHVSIATEDKREWVNDSWQISIRMICLTKTHLESQLPFTFFWCFFV